MGKVTLRRRLLLVAMADSVHVARWLEQLTDEDLSIELVSSSPHRKIHAGIEKLISGCSTQKLSLTISKKSRVWSLWLWLMDRVLGDRLRGKLLERAIIRFDPHVIHVLELQHGGYMLNRVSESALAGRTVAATNYGSDIFWFSRFKKHQRRIRQVLARADGYSAECARDLELAKRYGFKGEVSKIFPNTGGLSQESLEIGRSTVYSSDRNVVLVKGYQNKFGRAITALKALALISAEIQNYKVVIFSTNLSTGLFALWLKFVRQMDVEIHAKGAFSHSQMLALFRQSRLYIGLSRSDGISTSLLEAMAMGAFPIQTGTSCVTEWAEDGKTAFVVQKLSPEAVSVQIRDALLDDDLVDQAQKVNQGVIGARYSTTNVGGSIRAFYEELFALKSF